MFIVYLNILNFDFDFCLVFHRFFFPENILEADIHQPLSLPVSEHCVGLTSTSRSIGKNASVKAKKKRVNQRLGCLGVDITIVLITEDPIKSELLFPGSVVDLQFLLSFLFKLDIHRVKSDNQIVLHPDSFEVSLLLFFGQQRPHPNHHLNVRLFVFN